MRFKRMTEIYSRMVDHTITSTKEISDFSLGSGIRAIYESVSIELEQYYILTKENMKEAIELGVYKSFGFDRKTATTAYGEIKLTFYNDTIQTIRIPRGTKFLSSKTKYPQMYETRKDYIIPIGTNGAIIEVHSTIKGSYGNIPAGTINMMNTPIPYVDTVTNLAAFETGLDEEPMDDMRSRFRAYIESLSRATVPAIEYAVRSVREVSGAYVDEQVGAVTAYAYDSNGNLPKELVSKIYGVLETYRPAGIPVKVAPVIKKVVDVEVELTLTDLTQATEVFEDKIISNITLYMNSSRTSKGLVLTDLITMIKNIDTQLIYDVDIVTPTENTQNNSWEVIRAGIVDVKFK